MNMVDAVVVLMDRDEKIGDLVIIECNFGGAIYGCKMKDGTIYKLDIDILHAVCRWKLGYTIKML